MAMKKRLLNQMPMKKAPVLPLTFAAHAARLRP
jgi:hypothetical protein